jgi:pimeloyl-ACP methyl ester carboxylesterase
VTAPAGGVPGALIREQADVETCFRPFPRIYGFPEDDYTTWIVLRKSSLPDGYTLREMSDDNAAAVRRGFGQAVDVIGISTGGSIAQHFAADHWAVAERLGDHAPVWL